MAIYADLVNLLMENNGYFMTIVSTCVVLIVGYVFLGIHRLPPGPWGLPFIGHLPLLVSKRRARIITELAKKYKSDIISIRMYGKIIVFINSYELIKECFVKRADLVDRVDGAFLNIVDPGYLGIIGNRGPSWKAHRRFSLYMMRDFGMGKVRAEEIIQEETGRIMAVFRAKKGQPFDPQQPVNLAVSNIICSIIFGQRYDYDNQEFVSSLKSMNDLILKFGGSRIWLLLRTALGPYLLPNMIKEIQHYFDGFAKFARKSVQEHIAKYDEDNIRDLIDAYLKECYSQDKTDVTFQEKNLQYLIIDMFLAGSETTFTTLRWALLYMAAYPAVQERVYQELRDKINDRLPSMNDKKATPFTEATLSEVQRVNTLLPLGLFHTNLNQDFEIENYLIPKGTPVAANLEAVHRDPNIWENPNEFNPENFLQDGKVVNLEYLVPFSIGRRSCAGEALARMELYIFFTSWLLNFKVELADESQKPTLEGVHRGVWQPEPFQIRMVPRAIN